MAQGNSYNEVFDRSRESEQEENPRGRGKPPPLQGLASAEEVPRKRTETSKVKNRYAFKLQRQNPSLQR
jgi:hypothetical protein